MEVLFFLLPLSVLITGGAIVAFRWALRSGQMDDLDTPPVRILFDDADAAPRPAGQPVTPLNHGLHEERSR